MGAAGFVLTINIFVACLFAATFLILGWQTRTRAALWFGLTYLCAAFYIVSEFVLPFQGDPRITYVVGFFAFLLSLSAALAGLSERYAKGINWTLIGVMMAAGLASGIVSFELGRGSFARMMLYQAPYAALQLAGAVMILRAVRRDRLDNALAVLLVLGAAQFLSKPFVSMISGGPGATPQDYVNTSYALYSQTMGALVALTTGLMLLLIIVRDMLVEATLRSETDVLSGLYNRRGFEARAAALLESAQRTGVPTAMVVSDLDHFKAVNDSYGHEAGDRVIEWYSALLRDTAGERWVVGRMGGEEFAIFLSGANLTTARLFAESVRAGMSRLEVEGMPADFRVTASFGVAEGDGRSSLAELRRRADGALYRAKSMGRDRVASAAGGPTLLVETSKAVAESEPLLLETVRRG
jgi:diguanylate cyclase (GGDEF)-like protein